MSGNNDEGKEPNKAVPLDLARNQITTVRTVDGKPPLIMSGQTLRQMRVLTPNTSTSSPTIITTNIVPHPVFKHDPARTSILTTTSTQLQRPGQITLSTTPGATYHVPRGPAVVANLAAPRGNASPARPSLVAPRIPSPAPGAAAWLNTSNGKGATTVLSSPVRGASVAGKPTLVARSPANFSAIRPGTTILHSAITIGAGFKPGQPPAGVTLAQVVPARTQAVVYSPGGSQFAPRLAVATGPPRVAINRPQGVATARLTIPVGVTQGARIVGPGQATVLTPGARITAVSQAGVGQGGARVVTTPARVAVQAAGGGGSQAGVIGATRTLNLHSLVVAGGQARAGAQGAAVAKGGVAQGAIHFTPIPATIKTTPTVVTASNRTINVPVPTAIMSQRPSIVSSQQIPIAYSQGDGQPQGTANVFIHTPIATVPRLSSPTPSATNIPQTSTTTSTSYTIGSGTYFFETGGNYSTNSTRPFTTQQQQPTTFAALTQSTQVIRPTQVHGIVANQQMRFNPVMVVDQNRPQFNAAPSSEMPDPASNSSTTKLTSSPRPTILRKRDHEGSPVKAAKNLTPILTNYTVPQPLPSISPPSRPDSRGNGHSSAGSTTISATSSPGSAEMMNEDSMPHAPMNKDEEVVLNKPAMEMSPRKKPRKQQLTGNDIDEHNDDMQFITESNMIKHEDDSDGNGSDEPRDGAPEARQVTTVRKPASASMLNGYQHNWKATHNHYLRHSDVRPKDERKPNIMDLSNQYRVQDKVNGWKVHHLSTQMEDLAEQEAAVYNQLSELLRNTEAEEMSELEKDINRINELIKGNLQRVKIIKDGMVDAKSQIMKIFDHKVHVTDIINRCASKRNFKKREKSSF